MYPLMLCFVVVVAIFIDLMLLSEVVISLETSGNQTCGPLLSTSQQWDEINNMSKLTEFTLSGRLAKLSLFIVDHFIFCLT